MRNFTNRLRGACALLCTIAVVGGCHTAGETTGKNSGENNGMTHSNSNSAGVTKSAWGTTRDGQAVDRYTLDNGRGLSIQMMTLGATITSIRTPDKNGTVANIALGYDKLSGYESKDNPYFGATIGRYANRLARGTFSIDGKTYHVPINNGPNSLHGGDVGFSRRVWSAQVIGNSSESAVKFTLVSADGDQGYPGAVRATVVYSLTEKNEIKIRYTATSDQPTPINLTNHAYFNLSGEGSGLVLNTLMMLSADRFTPVDDTLIPTGAIEPVKGSPMDFTTPTAIGTHIDEIAGGGYDHNYVINDGGQGKMVLAARACDPASGRVLEVETDQPGIQFYTGNFLDGTITGSGGKTYAKHSAFCLETQHFPDSPNQSNFPNTVLRPGETFSSTTIYRFSTAK